MKLFRSQKGQLFIYFLVIVAAAALMGAVYFKSRLGQIKSQQRGSYVDELYLECRADMAVIDNGQYVEYNGAISLRNRALLNFMKVKNKEFMFSGTNIKKWVEYRKVLQNAGMLADTPAPSRIEFADIQDVRETLKNMALLMNQARVHDNNFMY